MSSSTSTQSSTSATSASSSDDGTSSTATKGGDLCRLITKSEAESYAGVALQDGKPTEADSPVGKVGSCVYLAATTGGAPTVVNVVIAGTKVTADIFDSQIASDASDATAVDGVGEKALLIQAGILAVLDHGVALTVEIIVAGQGAATDVLVKAAKNALDRL